MTSNTGSHIIQQSFENINSENKNDIIEETKNKVFDLLKKTIRPEFLNRIDETIMFTPLTKEDITEVVKIQLEGFKKMLSEREFKFEISEKAIEWIGEKGYNPQFGARPVKRVIQKHVLNELSKQILAGTVNNNHTINIDFEEGGLVFRN